MRKSVMKRIQDFFNSFFSIFIKKQKALPESLEETDEKYDKIKEFYQQITKDDSFENLKQTYKHYTVSTNSKGKTVAIEKESGYVVEEERFVKRVRFLAIWRKCAICNQDTKDEEASYNACFGEESEKVYNQIKECIQSQLQKTGNIDTLQVLNEMKKSEYKWGRSTTRRLFRNEIQTEVLTDFFRSLQPKLKRQTKKTLTTSQALYGLEEE